MQNVYVLLLLYSIIHVYSGNSNYRRSAVYPQHRVLRTSQKPETGNHINGARRRQTNRTDGRQREKTHDSRTVVIIDVKSQRPRDCYHAVIMLRLCTREQLFLTSVWWCRNKRPGVSRSPVIPQNEYKPVKYLRNYWW